MAVKGCSKEERLFTGSRMRLNQAEFAHALKWDLEKVNNVLTSLINKGDVDINLKNEIELYFFPPIKNSKEYREVLEGKRIIEYDNSEDELEFLRMFYIKGSSV